MQHILFFSLLFLATPAAAFDAIDVEIGSAEDSNEQRRAYKLNVIEVTQDTLLTEIAPYIDTEEADEIEYLVYQNIGGDTWSAVYRSGLVGSPDGEGFAPSEPLELELEAGGVYAMGLYIAGRNVRYYFETGLSLPDDIDGLGEHLGAVWVTDEGAEEMPDVIEDDIDPGTAYFQSYSFMVPVDEDGDGVEETEDCDDEDPSAYPGAVEQCDDIDNDCDGVVDNDPVYVTYYTDLDGDGYGGESVESCDGQPEGTVGSGGDCNDEHELMFPGAPERCNDLDDDCDGDVDEEVVFITVYNDLDGDGYGASSSSFEECDGVPEGATTRSGDCDDGNDQVFPSAPEQCNDMDDDCDGAIDEDVVHLEWWPDGDGDGYGDGSVEPEVTCDWAPSGFVGNDDDCDDGETTVNPGAPELCDEADNDCDGSVDEDVEYQNWFLDEDGDGYGDPETEVDSCKGPPGDAYIERGRDCDDAEPLVYPGAIEYCDGILNDCNGQTLEGEETDVDADGVPVCLDCNDTNPTIYPGAPELCDGFDHDCDGQVPRSDECDPFRSEALDVGSGCGASTRPGAPMGWLWAGVLGVLIRRRRGASVGG